ncbi:MAG: hypothetical protein ACI3Z0_10895 [Candidatus Cryptobacteroides sp.]
MNVDKTYLTPRTERHRVTLESGFLAASEQVEKIKTDELNIEVEDYQSFENEVTFE